MTQQSQPKTKKLAVPGFSVSEGAGERGGAKNRKDWGGILGGIWEAIRSQVPPHPPPQFLAADFPPLWKKPGRLFSGEGKAQLFWIVECQAQPRIWAFYRK